jgi:hypothetical protein
LQVRLLHWQKVVADDTHRFKIVCAGRRAGKSVLAQLTLLRWAVEKVGLYYLVSPSYRQGKSIHWRGLQEIIPKQWVEKKNEVELSITLKNGSIIELKGAENPDSLRGVKLRGLVVDEIASIRQWDWLWQEVLRPTLTDYASPALFISTPAGFNHFYSLFQMGQGGNPDYCSWRFTTYDNDRIPKEEIENAKKELSEETFAQEYMADFRTFTGLAFKQWDRQVHLIEPFDIPREWHRGRGFDYGSNDPTASVRVAIDPEDNWFVDSCYKNNHASIKDHANSVLAQDYDFGFVPIWGDPSGDQWEREFATYGLTIQSANKDIGQSSKGWVAFGIEKINERLKPRPGHLVRLSNGTVFQNAPRLFVLNTPENQQLVKEMELLQWKTTNTGQTLPILDESVDPDGHSDLCAALRYFAVSWEKPIAVPRYDASAWAI